MLAKAPEKRFQSVDATLSHALRKVIDNAGDKSTQVKYGMSMKNEQYGSSGDFIKGRELFAMILVSFNPPDHTEVFYNSHHLYVFNYYGDDGVRADSRPEHMPIYLQHVQSCLQPAGQNNLYIHH